jgi:hypothetical protein
LWKTIVERGRPQMTIWHMRIACWIPRATNTHTEYVIFIVFTLPQWLRERASMLRYTYITCLVITPSIKSDTLLLLLLWIFFPAAP